jgi:hypothetical protein
MTPSRAEILAAIKPFAAYGANCATSLTDYGDGHVTPCFLRSKFAALAAIYTALTTEPAAEEAQQTDLFFCNKCGYFGYTAEHGGCGYFAYRVKPKAPQPPTGGEQWSDNENEHLKQLWADAAMDREALKQQLAECERQRDHLKQLRDEVSSSKFLLLARQLDAALAEVERLKAFCDTARRELDTAIAAKAEAEGRALSLEQEIASEPEQTHYRRKWVSLQIDYGIWLECCRKHAPQFVPAEPAGQEGRDEHLHTHTGRAEKHLDA